MISVTETKYEVIRFIEHGERCRPAMDCQKGQLLIYRLKEDPYLTKEQLFSWQKQIAVQLALFHRCKNGREYRYLNPYSVLITEEENILLLDLESPGNDFVMRAMQKRSMRNHFMKTTFQSEGKENLSIDLYGFGRTLQFILSSATIEPALSHREEIRLEKVITKCLGEHPKRNYETIEQMRRDLPVLKKQREREWSVKKTAVVLAGIVLVFFVLFLFFFRGKEEPVKEESVETQKQAQEDVEEVEEPDLATEEGNDDADGISELAEEMDALRNHLLQNTARENQEVIEQGEGLHQELLRYLAAAYDREEMVEQALSAYEELCALESNEQFLESAYLRRITLQLENGQETEAVQTAELAMEAIPQSEEVALNYLKALCCCEAVSKEQYEEREREVMEHFPGIKETEGYQQMIQKNDLKKEEGKSEEK